MKTTKIGLEIKELEIRIASSIKFDGKNTKEVMKFLSSKGFKPNLEANGKLSVGKQTIFKDDVVSVTHGKLDIEKPAYVTGYIIPQKELKEIASEYNQFPKEFHNIERGALVYIMEHGDLDAALKGMGVLARTDFEMIYDKSVMVVKSNKPLPEGHVFVGLPRLKGYANAYVHKSQGGRIVIGSMSSHLEK